MKAEAIRHPKTKRLARLLELTLRDTLGLLEMLWHWTAEYADDGAIGEHDDADIAEAVAWEGEPQKLIDGLVDAGGNDRTGFLERHKEYRLIVHDWPDHCPRYVKMRLQRQGRDFVEPDPPEQKGRKRKAKCTKQKANPAKHRKNPYAEAFKAAFDESFPDAYTWIEADFVQLAKFRKDYPNVTPRQFVEVAKAHWSRGRYTSKSSLSIRGLCSDWAALRARAEQIGKTKAEADKPFCPDDQTMALGPDPEGSETT